MGEVIGGKNRFNKPVFPEDEFEGPKGEVVPIDLVDNLKIIPSQLMAAVRTRAELNRIPDRTSEQQAELEAIEARITELRRDASSQLIREGERRFIADSGPPELPSDSSA
jgi:uncharacterized protein with von Willebrand factor type A (vWA) domain